MGENDQTRWRATENQVPCVPQGSFCGPFLNLLCTLTWVRHVPNGFIYSVWMTLKSLFNLSHLILEVLQPTTIQQGKNPSCLPGLVSCLTPLPKSTFQELVGSSLVSKFHLFTHSPCTKLPSYTFISPTCLSAPHTASPKVTFLMHYPDHITHFFEMLCGFLTPIYSSSFSPSSLRFCINLLLPTALPSFHSTPELIPSVPPKPTD